jgi:protein-S-isoprenylcysteine O-methyltransferase Ste14
MALVLAPSAPALHASQRIAGIVLIAMGMLVLAAAFIALGRAFTPNPVPKPGAAMAAHGIYRFVRHPMYSAVLLCSLGWAAAFGGVWHYALCSALLAFFWAKSRAEERWLTQRYADYATYQARTGRFVPRLTKIASKVD